jgi:hypothetical protein
MTLLTSRELFTEISYADPATASAYPPALTLTLTLTVTAAGGPGESGGRDGHGARRLVYYSSVRVFLDRG